jgi:hypothetical protein
MRRNNTNKKSGTQKEGKGGGQQDGTGVRKLEIDEHLRTPRG